MEDPQSGVVAYLSASAARIEALARFGYSMRGLSMSEPPGVGIVLDELAGPCRVEEVPLGLRPGIAEVEFAGAAVARVRVAARQSLEDFSLAYGRGCAQIVAWMRGEDGKWSDAKIDAVALAIIMPAPAFLIDMATDVDVVDLARGWMVAPELALRRMQMLRGGHESGEVASAH